MSRLRQLWRKRRVKVPIAVALGAGAGFAYYWFIGCPTGGCPISSNPYLMSVLGALGGYTMVGEEDPPVSRT